MKIAYVTSNAHKFEEATHILSDWSLERVDLDLTEIQGTAKEIARTKAMDAAHTLNIPVIVEDVSMYCPALGGLPGPYIKDFLRSIGDEGLATLIQKFDDHAATVVCIAAFCEPGGEPIICSGELEGQIVPPRGEVRHGKLSWNPIFLPKGMERTMGEMTIAEHAQVSMRKKALEKLAQLLTQEHTR